MIVCMRTTISIDDQLGKAARERAAGANMSFSALVSRALREFLWKEDIREESPPFQLITAGGEGIQPGIDLDRTSDLLVAEDRDRYGSED